MLALIPAILGMVAGAKDEFLKMDIFLALGAIFLLGFSSDTVRTCRRRSPRRRPAIPLKEIFSRRGGGCPACAYGPGEWCA
jgi:hypothetical protein